MEAAELRRQNDVLRAQVAELVAAYQELEAESEAKEVRAGDSGAGQQEREMFTAALQELKAYSDQLVKDKSALQQQLDAVRVEASKAAAAAQADVAAAREAKAAAVARADALAAQIADLQKQLTAARQPQNDIRVDGEVWTVSRIKDCSETRDRLAREVSLAALRVEAAGDESKAAQAELASLRASHVPKLELEAALAKLSVAESKVAAAEDVEAGRAAAVAAAEAAAAAAQEATGAAVGRAEALTVQLAEVQDKLASAVSKGEDLEKDLVAARASIEELKEAKAAVEKRAAAALKEVQEQVAALTSAVTTIKEAASPPKPAGGWVWLEGGSGSSSYHHAHQQQQQQQHAPQQQYQQPPQHMPPPPPSYRPSYAPQQQATHPIFHLTHAPQSQPHAAPTPAAYGGAYHQDALSASYGGSGGPMHYGYNSSSSAVAARSAPSASNSGYLHMPGAPREPPLALRPAPQPSSGPAPQFVPAGGSSSVILGGRSASASGAGVTSTRVSAAAPGRLLW